MTRAKYMLLALIFLLLARAVPAGVAAPAGGEKAPDLPESLRGVHPRLYLSRRRVAELKELIRTSPAYAALWAQVKKKADALPASPPAFRDDGSDNMWLRGAGDAVSLLSFASLMTGDPAYREKARARAAALCGYPTWGKGPGNFCDLPVGHIYTGLATFYDWCGADCDAATRKLLRDTIVSRGAAYAAVLADPARDDYWQVLQNQFWVKASGLFLAALAVMDEAPEVKAWLPVIRARFQASFAALGPDGASTEGVGYWQYGLNALLRVMWNAREVLGEDDFATPWFSRTASYGLYLSTPAIAAPAAPKRGDRPGMNVDFGDCPRANWYGPDYLFRLLAREYHDPHAQWLAQKIDEAALAEPVEPWLNLVWFDPAVPAQSPAPLPTLKRFDDLGLVSARSDWSGEAALVAFKCGPALGFSATEQFAGDGHTAEIIKANSGHSHPDAASFCLFAAGEWQVPNAGYVQRRTWFENTLILNGKGQLGQDEKRGWWDCAPQFSRARRPRLLRADSKPELDLITGDATGNYDGLRRFVRHLVFVKPGLLLVLDDLEAENAADFELLYHFEKTSAEVRPAGDGSYVQAGARSRLRFTPFADGAARLRGADQDISARHGDGRHPRFMISLKTHAAQWRTAVAYTWSAGDRQPAAVSLERRGDRWVFASGGKRVSFDWSRVTAKVE